MDWKVIKFADTEIYKQKFYQHKRPILISNININKIVVSNKVKKVNKKSFNCFIRYKDVTKVTPLCIFLPKMSGYRKDFDETKYMSFWIKDDELLRKYNGIWEKCEQ